MSKWPHKHNRREKLPKLQSPDNVLTYKDVYNVLNLKIAIVFARNIPGDVAQFLCDHLGSWDDLHIIGTSTDKDRVEQNHNDSNPFNLEEINQFLAAYGGAEDPFCDPHHSFDTSEAWQEESNPVVKKRELVKGLDHINKEIKAILGWEPRVSYPFEHPKSRCNDPNAPTAPVTEDDRERLRHIVEPNVVTLKSYDMMVRLLHPQYPTILPQTLFRKLEINTKNACLESPADVGLLLATLIIANKRGQKIGEYYTHDLLKAFLASYKQHTGHDTTKQRSSEGYNAYGLEIGEIPRESQRLFGELAPILCPSVLDALNKLKPSSATHSESINKKRRQPTRSINDRPSAVKDTTIEAFELIAHSTIGSNSVPSKELIELFSNAAHATVKLKGSDERISALYVEILMENVHHLAQHSLNKRHSGLGYAVGTIVKDGVGVPPDESETRALKRAIAMTLNTLAIPNKAFVMRLFFDEEGKLSSQALHVLQAAHIRTAGQGNSSLSQVAFDSPFDTNDPETNHYLASRNPNRVMQWSSGTWARRSAPNSHSEETTGKAMQF